MGHLFIAFTNCRKKKNSVRLYMMQFNKTKKGIHMLYAEWSGKPVKIRNHNK